jgi:hypothetical protein
LKIAKPTHWPGGKKQASKNKTTSAYRMNMKHGKYLIYFLSTIEMLNKE